MSSETVRPYLTLGYKSIYYVAYKINAYFIDMNPSMVQTNDRGLCILIRSVIAGMYLKLVGNWIRTEEDSWN
jgi:hypothetical protein